MTPVWEPTPVAAAKVFARQVGDYGKIGGWIYSPNGQPIVQGWSAYSRILERRGIIKQMGNGRWAINWAADRRRS